MDGRIDDLRERLREDPSSRQFYQLAELLRRENELEEAADVLRTGLDHHPSYVAAWVALGRTLLAQGRHPAAENALREALGRDPENAVAARLLGESAAARHDWVAAIKALKRARALTPGDRELDEEIARVEEHLAPQLRSDSFEAPAPAPARDSADDVFSAPTPAPAVAAVPLDEDPFDVAPRGDTGVWSFGADVFELAVPPEPERAAAEAWPEDDPFAEAATSEATELEPVAGTTEPWGPEPVPPLAAMAPPEVRAEPSAEEATSLEETAPPPDPSGGAAQELEEPEAVPVAEEAAAPPPDLPSGLAVDTREELGGVEVTRPIRLGELPSPLEPEPEPEVEPEVEPEIETEIETTTASAADAPPPSISTASPAAEAAPAVEPVEPVEPDEPAPAVEELPLPTLTLARLALEQGEAALALRTVERVLQERPGDAQAEGLRSEILALQSAGDAPTDLRRVKVAALQRWMDGVRLAAGRRAP